MQILKVYTAPLATTLGPDELRAKALELASTVQTIGAEMEEQKNLKDQMKARLSELQARQTRLAMIISSGKEYRAVQVEVRMTDAGQVEEVRMDTGEIIATRPPYESERQLMMAAAMTPATGVVMETLYNPADPLLATERIG